MAGAGVQQFTDSDFETEVLKSDKPVLVDFWAEWCMPCRALAPTIDRLATQFAGKAKIGKVDVEKHQQVSFKYQISAIPTVLIFKNGEVRKKFVGMTNEGDLTKALNELVGA